MSSSGSPGDRGQRSSSQPLSGTGSGSQAPSGSLTPPAGSQPVGTIQALALQPAGAVALPPAPSTALTITVNRQSFSNLRSLLQYFDSLNPNARVGAVLDAQQQLQRGQEGLEDIGYEIWHYIQGNQVFQARRQENTAAFNSEFRGIREAFNKSSARRQRREEARKALVGSWCSEAFWNLVAAKQTNLSTAITDNLRRARTNFSPLQIFRDANSFRLQRLARIGPYSRYGAGDRSLIPIDFHHALTTPPEPRSILPQREAQAAASNQLTEGVNTPGLFWLDGIPPPNIHVALQNEGRPLQLPAPQSPAQPTITQPTVTQSPGTSPVTHRPATRSTIPKPPPTKSGPPRLLSSHISVEIPPRKQTPTAGQGARDIYDLSSSESDQSPRGSQRRDPKTSAEKRPRPVTPSKPTKASKPTFSPQEQYFSRPISGFDLVEQLKSLNLEDKKRAIKSPQAAKAVPLPLEAPSNQQKALWSIVLRKAEALAKERTVKMEPTAMTTLRRSTNLTSLIDDIAQLTEVVRNNRKSFPNPDYMAVYTEALYDISIIIQQIQANSHDSVTASRTLVADIGNKLGPDAFIEVGGGLLQWGGSQLDIRDLYSLVRDELSTGWVTDAAILAAIQVARQNNIDPRTGTGLGASWWVVDPNQWQAWYQQAERGDPLTVRVDLFPGGIAGNLLIPIHWQPNHWALGIINWEQGFIEYIDSASHLDPERINRFLNQARHFVALLGEPFARGNQWRLRFNDQGGQQTNDYDCGVWVIENARTVIENRELPHTGMNMAVRRRQIIEEILAHGRPIDPTNIRTPSSVNRTSSQRGDGSPARSQSRPRSSVSTGHQSSNTPRGSPGAASVGSPQGARLSPSPAITPERAPQGSRRSSVTSSLSSAPSSMEF